MAGASSLFLGIEIGGTKLQIAAGAGDGSAFVQQARHAVDPADGAAGIRDAIRRTVRSWQAGSSFERLGIGFGGPVLASQGRVITSHQIDGWDDFPLVDWCRQELGVPAVLANDCDSAALAEARFGAGRGKRIVLYVTVGTGIGGGLVVDGKIHGVWRPAATEVGHLRPGLDCRDAGQTVESQSSGRGIEAAAREWMEQAATRSSASSTTTASDRSATLRDEKDLLARARQNASGPLTARQISEAAREGSAVSREIIARAVETLGWGIAQAVTLTSPERVVVGGGVSMMPEELFLRPLREAVGRYVFPPLRGAFDLMPPALGEEVVVHGALALAASG